MANALSPYLDLLKDAGMALTDAGFAYGLLVAAGPLLTFAGLLLFFGLIATHGKSHGTRFSAMAVFVFAALASLLAWLLKPEAAAGTALSTLLTWAWAPPLAAALGLFATMPKEPKPRALGIAFAAAMAFCATAFGGMLTIANERALNPDGMTWLDAPNTTPDMQPEEATDPRETLSVVDTAPGK